MRRSYSFNCIRSCRCPCRCHCCRCRCCGRYRCCSCRCRGHCRGRGRCRCHWRFRCGFRCRYLCRSCCRLCCGETDRGLSRQPCQRDPGIGRRGGRSAHWRLCRLFPGRRRVGGRRPSTTSRLECSVPRAAASPRVVGHGLSERCLACEPQSSRRASRVSSVRPACIAKPRSRARSGRRHSKGQIVGHKTHPGVADLARHSRRAGHVTRAYSSIARQSQAFTIHRANRRPKCSSHRPIRIV